MTTSIWLLGFWRCVEVRSFHFDVVEAVTLFSSNSQVYTLIVSRFGIEIYYALSEFGADPMFGCCANREKNICLED